MSTLTIHFTPPDPAPANGYKVLYRAVGGSTYSQVTPNPTSSPVAITGIDPTVSYEGSIQSLCSSTIGSVIPFTATACTCGSGYIVSVDKTHCYKYLTADPTVLHSDYCLAVSQNAVYSLYGTRIYTTGVTQADIEASSPGHLYTSITSAGYWKCSSSTTGPMNRCSVWVDSDCDGTPDALTGGAQTTISYLYNNTSGSPKTVYIGIGGDNEFTLQINGVVVISTDSLGVTGNFRWWHIIPVTLVEGNNIINLTGTGDGTANDAIGMTIYGNTASELVAATSDSDLNIIFTTSSLVGQHIDIATCASGYDLDTSGGSGHYICKQLTTAALICS